MKSTDFAVKLTKKAF